MLLRTISTRRLLMRSRLMEVFLFGRLMEKVSKENGDMRGKV